MALGRCPYREVGTFTPYDSTQTPSTIVRGSSPRLRTGCSVVRGKSTLRTDHQENGVEMLSFLSQFFNTRVDAPSQKRSFSSHGQGLRIKSPKSPSIWISGILVRPDCLAALRAIFFHRAPPSQFFSYRAWEQYKMKKRSMDRTPSSVTFSTTQSILSPLPIACANVMSRGDSLSGR